MRYVKLFENFESTKKVKFYHITDKENLTKLLSGIKVDRAATWGQGPGFYVSTSEKYCEEQEGVGSRLVDLMIEIETELTTDNFDIDYEMNYNLSEIVENQIPQLNKIFANSFIISKGREHFLIFSDKLESKDFTFEPVSFRKKIIGYIPNSTSADWCYLPLKNKNIKKPKVKIINNIYGAPLTKNFIEKLDKYGYREKIKEAVFSSIDDVPNVALRYIGPVIYPTRYKFKNLENQTWSKWKIVK